MDDELMEDENVLVRAPSEQELPPRWQEAVDSVMEMLAEGSHRFVDSECFAAICKDPILFDKVMLKVRAEPPREMLFAYNRMTDGLEELEEVGMAPTKEEV